MGISKMYQNTPPAISREIISHLKPFKIKCRYKNSQEKCGSPQALLGCIGMKLKVYSNKIHYSGVCMSRRMLVTLILK